MSGHGKVVCSCGAVITQCKCPENHNVTSTISNGCEACKNANTKVKDKAEQIIDAVWHDLSGRSGIGNELDMIDTDIKTEVKHDLIEIVQGILASN